MQGRFLYLLNDVASNSNGTAYAWSIGKGKFVVQLQETDLNRRVREWKFATLVGHGVGCDIWVYVIPSRKFPWVTRQLNLPTPRKAPGRVRYGCDVACQRLKKGAGPPSQSRPNDLGDTIADQPMS